MIGLLRRLIGGGAPQIRAAHPREAAAIAKLHGRSFHRGWSDEEVESLLVDRSVLAHSLRFGGVFTGFVLSRCAADEAEILSIVVDRRYQGRGFARQLLNLHLGRLAALGIKALFLEVDENNAPAIRLYRAAGFREVARRPNYYPLPGGRTAAALVLRRDIA